MQMACATLPLFRFIFDRVENVKLLALWARRVRIGGRGLLIGLKYVLVRGFHFPDTMKEIAIHTYIYIRSLPIRSIGTSIYPRWVSLAFRARYWRPTAD
jgi:hypothetical protein